MLLESMNKVLLLLLSLPCVVGCRTAKYQVDVGPFFAVADGDLSLQNSTGSLSGNYQNDVDSDLGLGETETSPYARLQFDNERHRIRLQGFGIEASGSGVLASDFGNIVAGAAVSTELDFYAIGANYGYRLLGDRNYRVAIGAEAMLYSLDVTARSTIGRESVTTEVVVPMAFVEAEYLYRDFTVGANAGLMSADLGDANGRYLDIEGYVRLQMTKEFDLMGGYRYLIVDAYGKADSQGNTSRKFDADVEIQGFFFTAGIRF